MSFRWSEDTTTKFVEHYLKHECLWNIKSVAYKNKQIKNSAYEDLEKTMNISGFTAKEIKAKIKNLRSTYSQELKKIKDSKKSGTGTDTIYVPTIKWFQIMDESLRNLNSTLTENAEETISEGNNSSNTFREPEPKSKPMAKKKRLNQLTSMVSQLKEITETVNTKSTEEENEFEVFGKHVGLQLKAMPLTVALEAQEHIQLYINQIRRQQLQNASKQNRYNRSSTPSSFQSQPSPSNSMTSNPTSTYYTEDYYSEEQDSQEIPFTPQYSTTDGLLMSNILAEAMTDADV
ncbi:hypothetical protein RI129_003041 [Pyrocoelia pectoralis]|uniref:MADF domain-containing protein n=1 Tax=Pyrocoelia pectoralis TaxID=417401 RepID=A0AAN7VQ87_9COLE